MLVAIPEELLADANVREWIQSEEIISVTLESLNPDGEEGKLQMNWWRDEIRVFVGDFETCKSICLDLIAVCNK